MRFLTTTRERDSRRERAVMHAVIVLLFMAQRFKFERRELVLWSRYVCVRACVFCVICCCEPGLTHRLLCSSFEQNPLPLLLKSWTFNCKDLIWKDTAANETKKSTSTKVRPALRKKIIYFLFVFSFLRVVFHKPTFFFLMKLSAGGFSVFSSCCVCCKCERRLQQQV